MLLHSAWRTLKKQQEERTKRVKIEHKQQRSQEHNKRHVRIVITPHLSSTSLLPVHFVCKKQWVRWQHIIHSYGENDECINEEDVPAEVKQSLESGNVSHSMPQSIPPTTPDIVDIVVGQPQKMQYKYGSTTHEQTSHHECPLKKN